ncbi:MAG TPA: hypothetical protein VM409_03190, partial [Chloroflexia bacterium]|nr:hypothetical protein [Chloroflexia bacterium]
MEPASIEQALQYCLENPDNLSTDELLSKFPRYRDELESLLAFDKQLGSSLPLQMPAESKALVKQRIVNRVAAGRPDHAPEKEAPAMEQVAANAPASGKPWWRRSLFTGVAALVLLAVLWWGAATSLPDNPLYPVKLGTQNFFLNFAGGSTALIRGHLDLGNMRLVDIRSLQAGNALGKAGPALDDYNYHLDNCLNLWQQRNDDADVDLAKLIYASSVAGQRTLAVFGDSANALPEQIRSNVRDTTTTIDKLQTGSSKIL